MRKELEVQSAGDPKDFTKELKGRPSSLSKPERKYHLQVALKDVEFHIDQERAKKLGLSFLLGDIDEAERALRAGIVVPIKFIECEDETVHEVIKFDPTPDGYSGLGGCVTYSLAWTNQGIFEIGRYASMSIPEFSKTWQWFIYGRVLNADQVKELLPYACW